MIISIHKRFIFVIAYERMMKKNYSQYPKHLLAVDCIIFGFDGNNLKILLIKRNFEPKMGEWSLMGGFIGDNETLDSAANRVLNSLTGLENIYLEQLRVYSEIEREPTARIISVSYYALINIENNFEINEKYSYGLNGASEYNTDFVEFIRKELRGGYHTALGFPEGVGQYQTYTYLLIKKDGSYKEVNGVSKKTIFK